MKKCYTCQVEKQINDYAKNSSVKGGISNVCRMCQAENKRKYYLRNRDEFIRKSKLSFEKRKLNRPKKEKKPLVTGLSSRNDPNYMKIYYEQTKHNRKYVSSEKLKEKARLYSRKNREVRLQKAKEYLEKNRDVINERSRLYKKNNKDVINSINSERRIKKNRFKLKEDKVNILKIYKDSLKLKSYGFDVQVDHIIPINHDIVCGLHVSWNLQILTKDDNIKKSNKFDGTYENQSWRDF